MVCNNNYKIVESSSAVSTNYAGGGNIASKIMNPAGGGYSRINPN